LKAELAEEKVTRVNAQAEAEILAGGMEDLKKSADGFVSQVVDLEDKIKHLDNKVIDGLTKLHTKELSLE
jgi:predicted  nucleic acid-binding Zn-ribbon protein